MSKKRGSYSSGLEAAILIISLPVWLYSISIDLIGVHDPGDIVVAIGVSFLSCLEAEI